MLHFANTNISLTGISAAHKSPCQAEGWIPGPDELLVLKTLGEHEQFWPGTSAAAQFEKPCRGHVVLTVLLCFGSITDPVAWPGKRKDSEIVC